MTGMVTPWLYNPNNSQFLKFHFPLQGGRFDPAAGHQLPVWEASYTTHYFNNPGTGASSFRFFKKSKNQYRDEKQS